MQGVKPDDILLTDKYLRFVPNLNPRKISGRGGSLAPPAGQNIGYTFSAIVAISWAKRCISSSVL